MNNLGSFIFGTVTGVAVGGIAAALITRNIYEKRCIKDINEMEEALEKYRNLAFSDDEDEVYDDEEDYYEEMPVKVSSNSDERINSNDGVKKYHHKVEESMASAAAIFEKKGTKDVTEGEKALKANPKFDPDGDPNIVEISKEKYQEIVSKKPIEGWSTDSLTYLYPQDELYYGYGTDNEELAETHYDMGREQIMGQSWRWATDYTDGESGVGYCYIDNSYLKKLFDIEIVVDLDLEEEDE